MTGKLCGHLAALFTCFLCCWFSFTCLLSTFMHRRRCIRKWDRCCRDRNTCHVTALKLHRFDKGSSLLPVFSVLLQGQSETKGPLESSCKAENWDQTPVSNVFWNPATCVRVAKKERGSVSRSTQKPELTKKVWQIYHHCRIRTAHNHQLMCQSKPVSDSSNSLSTV